MLPVHRLLLPCLHQLDASRDYSSSSSSSSQQLGGAVQQTSRLHTQPAPATVSQLTDEQRQELKHAVVGRWVWPSRQQYCCKVRQGTTGS